ncbi:hypothetical protein CDAR_552261 [Caerostris darwini]|uniref:Uncharacterized protein n=1 Tax=Caerostris darwini TaxID=1538125 RepID=A0AAV4NJK7_9ARAC|nr:hypothetical protein CDAR_552261 [Caerostris darwini]
MLNLLVCISAENLSPESNSKEQSREDDPNCRKMGQSCHSGMKCCTGLACNQLVLGMGYSSLRCGRA